MAPAARRVSAPPSITPVAGVPVDRADAFEDIWETLERRPVHLQAGSSGDCPVSSVDPVGPWRGLGTGPVYPVGAVDGVVRYGAGQEIGGARVAKVLWVSAPVYRGPALVRGRQLGGPNQLVFPLVDGTVSTTLRFPVWTGVSSPDAPDGWRQLPSYLGFRAPGCYAVQVDGINFSRVLVFRAEP